MKARPGQRCGPQNAARNLTAQPGFGASRADIGAEFIGYFKSPLAL